MHDASTSGRLPKSSEVIHASPVLNVRGLCSVSRAHIAFQRSKLLSRRLALPHQPNLVRATATSSASAAAPTTAPYPSPATLTKPQRVCIMVEPSPFTYVCGYMNRFRNTIRFLVAAGCEVMVVTPGKGVCLPGSDASAFVDQPEDFHGATVVETMSFSLPWYGAVPLSFGLSPRVYKKIKEFKPDIVHCSSPGVMVLAALLYSRLLKTSLVYSYHTHVPEYMPRYNLTWLVSAMWGVLRFFHGVAHLTLTTSGIMAEELKAFKVADPESITVWKKGICSDTFHPQFRCSEMRKRLSGGHPEAPLLLSVGRLGSEKNLKFIKHILDRVPEARLAFVGDGPSREELKQYFAGTNTVFMGMLHGEELSAAYASADIFIMPSESETLGFVVLEAMASSIPVVAVRAGGIPDILTKQGETGYLYESGDIDGAVALVQQLVTDADLRERVGAAAREEVSKWDWKAATMYLLERQYPMAMAAAAAYYGKAVAKVAEGGDGVPAAPVIAATA